MLITGAKQALAFGERKVGEAKEYIVARFSSIDFIAKANADGLVLVNNPLSQEKMWMLDYLYEKAGKKDYSVLAAIIHCETGGTWDNEIQSEYYAMHKGVKVRETSYGLAQIYRVAHPDVKLSEAIDPKFAMDFLVEKYKAGDAWMWSCWSNGNYKRYVNLYKVS